MNIAQKNYLFEIDAKPMTFTLQDFATEAQDMLQKVQKTSEIAGALLEGKTCLWKHGKQIGQIVDYKPLFDDYRKTYQKFVIVKASRNQEADIPKDLHNQLERLNTLFEQTAQKVTQAAIQQGIHPNHTPKWTRAIQLVKPIAYTLIPILGAYLCYRFFISSPPPQVPQPTCDALEDYKKAFAEFLAIRIPEPKIPQPTCDALEGYKKAFAEFLAMRIPEPKIPQPTCNALEDYKKAFAEFLAIRIPEPKIPQPTCNASEDYKKAFAAFLAMRIPEPKIPQPTCNASEDYKKAFAEFLAMRIPEPKIPQPSVTNYWGTQLSNGSWQYVHDCHRTTQKPPRFINCDQEKGPECNYLCTLNAKKFLPIEGTIYTGCMERIFADESEQLISCNENVVLKSDLQNDLFCDKNLNAPWCPQQPKINLHQELANLLPAASFRPPQVRLSEYAGTQDDDGNWQYVHECHQSPENPETVVECDDDEGPECNADCILDDNDNLHLVKGAIYEQCSEITLADGSEQLVGCDKQSITET